MHDYALRVQLDRKHLLELLELKLLNELYTETKSV